MPKMLECVICNRQFELLPNKPGKINECPYCAVESTEKVMGEIYWESKQTSVMTISASPAKARQFAQLQRRNGPAPLASMITPKESASGRESSKSDTGAGIGDQYHSKLGEKHRVGGRI